MMPHVVATAVLTGTGPIWNRGAACRGDASSIDPRSATKDERPDKKPEDGPEQLPDWEDALK